MVNQTNDVKEEATPTTPSVEKEQTITNSEVVNTQMESEVEKYKRQIDNLKKAQQEEFKKLREAREERKAVNSQPASQEPEGVEQEWENIKNTVKTIPQLNQKIMELEKSKQPYFDDRKDLVFNMMRTTGMTLDQADDAVLARIMRENLQAEKQQPHYNSLKISATPEQKSFRSSGDPLKDLLNNPQTNPMMREAIKRKLGM
jgi:hypothetical protein